MAGIVYMKSNSSVSLTGAEYTGLSIPSGCKTLYVQTGNATSDRVKYGLTTDPTATSYSPVINVSGTTMMIARQSTISETVTTGTSYHTGTRESTIGTAPIFSKTLTTNVNNLNTVYKGNAVQWKVYGTYLSSRLEFTYLVQNSTGLVLQSQSTFTSYMKKSALLLNTQITKYAQALCTGVAMYGTYPTDGTNTVLKTEVLQSGSSFRRMNYSIFPAGLYNYNYSSTLYYATKGYICFSSTGTYTITTASNTSQGYATTESTYTSRTEYLTSLSTRTTNNAA